MIVFHEGLPGSGKSYEACVMHIVPALKAGRDVLTNINGISHEKFAELTELPLKVVQMLLVCISHSEIEDEEQRLEAVKASILDKTKKDSMVVIDEIQDIHPTGRTKLSGTWSKYIASHRHEGLDIILMGQDRRDVHPIWRRRIQRLITFNKMQAVGAPNAYRWECYEATRPEKFKLVTSGVRKYEQRYFGCYASHTAGTSNTSPYSDDRANVLKNKKLRLIVIAIFIVPFFAVGHIKKFFGVAEADEVVQAKPVEQKQHAKSHSITHQPAAPAIPAEPAGPPPAVDLFEDHIRKYRPRLAGFAALPDLSEFTAQVDIMNTTGHRVDSFTVRALEDMGWLLTLRHSGLQVEKEGRKYLIRPWPMDSVVGQVDRATREAL